jgi:cytoskeletal protein RodZ
MKKQPKTKGFSTIEGLLILVIVLILGGVGWYVWHSTNDANKTLNEADKTSNSQALPKQQSTTSTKTAKSYNPSVVSKIANFDNASDSLKEALVNVYYNDAKKVCDEENAQVSPDARLDYVITVQKMVRDDFAKVQFCGSGGSSIMAKTGGEWKNIGSLAMAPGCNLVDQYKISKEITATCYIDGQSTIRNVTYP